MSISKVVDHIPGYISV